MNYPLESELGDELQQNFIFRDTLEMRRENEHSRADRECQLAKAISDLGFAWNVLKDDVDNAHFSYIPSDIVATVGKRLAISKALSINVAVDQENKFKSFAIGDRVPFGGAEELVIVKGAAKEEMLTRYYEFDDPFGVLSDEKPFSKIVVLPHFAPEVNLVSSRADSLDRYLGLPLRQRAALQRYHQKHSKSHGARW